MKYIFLLSISLLASCTVEQSSEERVREDTDREYERLSYAVGQYGGQLVNSPDVITPMAIGVEIKRNFANNAKPYLAVSLQIGCFGGVILSSTSTVFDWGTQELIATFSRKEAGSAKDTAGGGSQVNGPGFELRGHIIEGDIADGTLVGSHFGLRHFSLKKGEGAPFEKSTNFAYDVKWHNQDGAVDVRAALKIKGKPTTETAPGTSDLAYLPGLEGSLEIEWFASAPQIAVATFYDPTTATLDFQFSDYSWIHASGVGLDPTGGKILAPKGTLVLGGSIVRDLVLMPVEKVPALASFPPPTYLGTYQGSPEALVYKAVAYLKPLGGTLSNTLNLPFLAFPKMRMELDICNGVQVMDQATLQLTVMDYLGHKAVFHRLETEQDPFEVVFSNDWARLDGVFLQVDQHEGGKQPTVMLKPNPEVAKLGCAVHRK